MSLVSVPLFLFLYALMLVVQELCDLTVPSVSGWTFLHNPFTIEIKLAGCKILQNEI